ncbi:MAG: HD domain-containing protein [Clostridia bacterium]
MLTFNDVKTNTEVNAYIMAGNEVLGEMGYTEHGFGHAMKCSVLAGRIVSEFGGSARETELAEIAGYMHDIGNMINRNDHAQTGAILALDILRRLGMSPEESAKISTAIGNHDEDTGKVVSTISAALILADKADVHRARVRSIVVNDDIHDRVNYAVTESALIIDEKKIMLKLKIDTEICSVIEYFKIFLNRMYMCQAAAHYLGTQFSLNINETVLM